MDVQKYRVKPGAELAHAGLVLTGGTDLELPPHIAHEVRHLVDPLDPVTGEVRAWGTAADAALESELAKALPHERVSLIEQALAANTLDGDKLRGMLASEKKRNELAAKAPEKKDGPKTGPSGGSATSPGKDHK